MLNASRLAFPIHIGQLPAPTRGFTDVLTLMEEGSLLLFPTLILDSAGFSWPQWGDFQPVFAVGDDVTAATRRERAATLIIRGYTVDKDLIFFECPIKE